MALVSMKEMLVQARAEGRAVGAFEFWSLDSAQAVVLAAQELGVPVILQNGALEANHARGYDKLRKIAEMAAEDVDVPVALHLDHAETVDQVRAAIEAGYPSVMIDASHCEYGRNVELTYAVVEMAGPLSISVESELGVLAGVEGSISRSDAEALQTRPDEAARFVADTGVDALAVAVGTAHGFYRFEPKLNIERLAEIAGQVSVPLVLHGGSGTPDDQVRRAIGCGIAKINICTEFVAAYGCAYGRVQREEGFHYNVPNLFTAAALEGQVLVSGKMRLFDGRCDA